jgi:micrococcal nuclease
MSLHWIFLFFFLIFPFFSQSATAKIFSGKVIKVFDGDTFLVQVQGREDFVRLREIDAPEIANRKQLGQEPWGKKAREFARSRVEGKKVRLEVEEEERRDPYQRLLAYVFVGELFVNLEMVRSGNAFFYRSPFRGKYATQLEKAEEVAREKGVGVWDRKNGLSERPRDFRSRTKKEDGLFSPSAPVPIPPNKVVGNKRSMVYHLPGSAAAAKVSPQNRVFFDSPEEAERAGFRRARSPSPQNSSHRPGKFPSLHSAAC